MGCHENKCETKEQKCNEQKKECHSSGCDFTDMLMRQADRAWNEVVIEKMKEQFKSTMGEKIDKIAVAGVKASITHWENKMKAKMDMHQEMENIKKSMM
jgi:hypothetical protein